MRTMILLAGLVIKFISPREELDADKMADR